MSASGQSSGLAFSGASAKRPVHVAWSALTDIELVGTLQSGERAALTELMRRYKQSIARYAYSLTRNRDETDDLIASANARICLGIATCRSSTLLSAWIRSTVRNAWYDMLRIAQRRPTVSIDVLPEGEVNRFQQSDLIQPSTSPELCAEENERNGLLYDAVAALPENQRVTVIRYYRDGMTYEEVAHRMCVPVGTVKSRLNRARLALRERLESQKLILVN